jgi:hypothetical protein
VARLRRRRRRRAADLAGLWTLDAEHNPAPLSPAHAGLISRLASERPDLVTARVLAGWLYEPTRPRTPPTTTAADALHALQHVHIPAARAWLTAWDRELAAADADRSPPSWTARSTNY